MSRPPGTSGVAPMDMDPDSSKTRAAKRLRGEDGQPILVGKQQAAKAALLGMSGYIANPYKFQRGPVGGSMWADEGVPDMIRFCDASLDNTNPTFSPIPNGGIVLGRAGANKMLNGMSTGDNPGERNGRAIKNHAVYVNLSLQTAGVSDCVRVVLVADYQANGTLATWQDVFNTSAYDGFPNLLNQTRFDILFDKFFNLSTALGRATDVVNRELTQEIRWTGGFKNPLITVFKGNGQADVNVASTSLLMFACSKNGTVTFSGKYRVLYSDYC